MLGHQRFHGHISCNCNFANLFKCLQQSLTDKMDAQELEGENQTELINNLKRELHETKTQLDECRQRTKLIEHLYSKVLMEDS